MFYTKGQYRFGTGYSLLAEETSPSNVKFMLTMKVSVYFLADKDSACNPQNKITAISETNNNLWVVTTESGDKHYIK